MAFCANCGKENEAGTKRCAKCDTPLIPTEGASQENVKTCGNCGDATTPGGRYCPSCGARICPKCDEALQSAPTLCQKCGHVLPDPLPSASGRAGPAVDLGPCDIPGTKKTKTDNQGD